MPIVVNNVTVKCFVCGATARISITIFPSPGSRPALPAKWAYFEREGAPHCPEPYEEVFCPKHHPKKDWQRLPP